MNAAHNGFNKVIQKHKKSYIWHFLTAQIVILSTSLKCDMLCGVRQGNLKGGVTSYYQPKYCNMFCSSFVLNKKK